MVAAGRKYVWNILIAVDQLANTLLLGDPDETLSSRMGKHVAKRECGACRLICWILDQIQVNHCQRSIEVDEGKDAIKE